MNTSVIDISAMSQQRPQINDTTAIVQVIERAARDSSIDIDKMERLLAMQERVLARDAETRFNEAMAACQAEMPQIVPRSENEQTHSMYAALEQIDRVARPIYTKHGFALSFGTADCPIANFYRQTCKVSHRSGHAETCHADLPLDNVGIKGNANKTGVQGFGSTMSYGQRYITKLVFNIVIGGEDNDGNTGGGETISEQQIAELETLLGADGQSKSEFMNWAKIRSLAEIQIAGFDDCVRVIKSRAKPATYDQAKFDQNLPKWSALITSGKKTAAQIIATVEAAAPLSVAQKKTINDLKVAKTETAK